MMTPAKATIVITEVKVTALDPAPYNPRKITPAQLAALERSIREFGFVDPIVANKRRGRKNVVIGGHQRLKAAKRIGLETVPVVYVDLDETREKALNIALNKITGEWDEPQLLRVLEDIDQEGFDVTLTGYDGGEIDALMKKLAEDAVEDEAAEDPPKNPITRLGDLYEIGSHRLLCGDATEPAHVERLMAGREAAMVFTDPPYGVAYRGTADFGLIKGDKPRTDDSFVEFLAASFLHLVAQTRDDGAFYIWHDPTTRREFQRALDIAGLEERQYLIWVKEQFSGLGLDDYRSDFEPCFYAQKIGHEPAYHAGRDQPSVWRVARRAGEQTAVALANGLQIAASDEDIYIGPDKPKRKNVRRLRIDENETIEIAGNRGDGTVWSVHRGDRNAYTHPTQKPIGLGQRAIRNSSKRGDIVLDLFAGSGSTLEAAHELGRSAYLMELDAGYCDVITARAERLGLDVHLAEPAPG